MIGPVQLSIVIPAFMEELRLGNTLKAIFTYLELRGGAAEVIVADDGSRDRTAEVARAGGATLVQLSENKGKGAALRAGVAASRGDLVLLCDADLSTPIDEVEKLEVALARGADLAFGSRSVEGSDVGRHQSRHRELMGRSFNMILHLLGFGGLRDTQCGFKLLRGDLARALFATMKIEGFAYDVELLDRARRQRLKVVEVGVVWNNSPDSRVHPVLDSARMLRDVLRLRLGLH